jgi:hypothetical protein
MDYLKRQLLIQDPLHAWAHHAWPQRRRATVSVLFGRGPQRELLSTAVRPRVILMIEPLPQECAHQLISCVPAVVMVCCTSPIFPAQNHGVCVFFFFLT